MRQAPAIPLNPAPAIKPIPIQQPLVIVRIALGAVQAAVQIHPFGGVRAGLLPVLGLAVQDGGVVGLRVEGLGV